jgi:hypothetical protein
MSWLRLGFAVRYSDRNANRKMTLMTQVRWTLPIMLGGVLVSGCVERTVYDTPRLQTRVVDAMTGRPVAGASVAVWRAGDNGKRATGLSDADGNILIEPLTRETMVLAPFDPIPPGGHARIEARGYKPTEINVPAVLSPATTTALSPTD